MNVRITIYYDRDARDPSKEPDRLVDIVEISHAGHNSEGWIYSHTFTTNHGDSFRAEVPFDRLLKEEKVKVVNAGFAVGTLFDKYRAAIDSEVEAFKAWQEGDCWGYVMEQTTGEFDENGELEWIEVDSCWGFYGDDPFTNGISDHIPAEYHKALKNAEWNYS